MRETLPHDQSMSFKDYTRPFPAVTRSRSFGGGIMTSKRNSLTSPTSPVGTPVLGESFRGMSKTTSNPDFTQGLSNMKKAKLPKTPRPVRALQMFESVKNGVRDCINSTHEDIKSLRASEDISAASSTGQGKVIEIEKQVKAAERYIKRLEFHLAKIEELEDCYKLQQQLREGARVMAQAYETSPGDHKKESLKNVKSGYSECTQLMCAIEAQLENMMGTFSCTMKGLVGFARLMPGDTYEVSVKHGSQKWKSRGRIGLDTQHWDNHTFVFKALLGEVFHIKAVENKSLKSLTLGQKNCETKDLFSSHLQMMTISINATGSIKLSIVVQWNPLHGVDEHFTSVLEPALRSQSTPRRRIQSMYVTSTSDSFSDVSSEHSSVGSSNRFSAPAFGGSASSSPVLRPRINGNHKHGNHDLRPNSIAIMGTISEFNDPSGVASNPEHRDSDISQPQLYDMRFLHQQGYGSSPKHEQLGLEDAFSSLRLTLEDYQGQYTELRKLEEVVHSLGALLRKNSNGLPTKSSSDDISIENALGAFDFLENEYYLDGYGSGRNSRRSSLDQLESKCTLSPESTAKTADSGIECIANRLSEHQSVDGSNPDCVSTGNEQVDTTLAWHLTYSEKLLENLGHYGPLKCKEIYSLEKLRRQADIIEDLIHIAKRGSTVDNLQEVMNNHSRDKGLKQLWVQCVDNLVLFTQSEKFICQLERTCGDVIRDKFDVSTSQVFKKITARILDSDMFDPDVFKPCPIITMHQAFNFFNMESCDVFDYILRVAQEVYTSQRLTNGDTDIAIKTVLTFKDSLPPLPCLLVVAKMMLCDNVEVSCAMANYLKGLGSKESQRKKAIVVFVEGLEDNNPETRCMSCVALRLLQASEGLEQLVFLSQSDPSAAVKKKAKEAVLSFGEEGQKAYQESELTSHGFQGVNMSGFHGLNMSRKF